MSPEPGVPKPMRDHTPAGRSTRILVGSILATGLLLPAFLGAIVRTILVAKGVQVVSWSLGAMWLFPLTFLFFIPFALLAFLTRFTLLRIIARETMTFQKWWHIFVGAFLGVALKLGFLLTDILQSIEAIAHMVALWPITIFLVLIRATGGAFIGAAIGWIVWAVRVKLAMRG